MTVELRDARRQLQHLSGGMQALFAVNRIEDAAAHLPGGVCGTADGKEILQLLNALVHLSEQRHHVDRRFVRLDRMLFHIGT